MSKGDKESCSALIRLASAGLLPPFYSLLQIKIMMAYTPVPCGFSV